jgi:acetylornithine deacetylase/succinyl-diaminopimelate desuccinylase-like protein
MALHPLVSKMDWATLAPESLELFRTLLRFDTTNPPGLEEACARHLASVLEGAGLAPQVLVAAPGRANVVCRLKGKGTRPPLLLGAHLDVVPADPARWSHPPFAAEIHDGYVYGRGAIDMKNMAAMSVSVMCALARSGCTLERDLIFAGVADEEVGCDHGSRFLVEQHPELVRAEYALGELGGFTLYLNGRTLYPIQVAEKGLCWVRVRMRGKPGHGSIPTPENTTVRLAEAVARVGRTRLPMHGSEAVRRFIHAMAATQPTPARQILPLLLKKRVSEVVLDRVMPDRQGANVFNALLRNTANPTVLRAGTKTNVVPGVAEAELDGRIAIGSSVEEFLSELRAVLGPDAEIEVLQSAPPTETTPDTEVFRTLSQVVADHDPGSVAIPYVIPGFTDAKWWSTLGIKCYGFSPVRFDPRHDVKFSELFHGDDERVPVDGYHFGVKMLFDAVARITGARLD